MRPLGSAAVKPKSLGSAERRSCCCCLGREEVNRSKIDRACRTTLTVNKRSDEPASSHQHAVLQLRGEERRGTGVEGLPVSTGLETSEEELISVKLPVSAPFHSLSSQRSEKCILRGICVCSARPCEF